MSAFPSLAGKTVFVVSHELNRKGAPLLLLETTKKMIASGANVLLTSQNEDFLGNPLLADKGFELIDFEYSFLEASKADLVIVNTAVCKTWVKIFLERFNGAGSKLIWWIHELSPDQSYLEYGTFGDGLVYLDEVRCALFDSAASHEMWEKSSLALPANVKVVNPCVSDEFITTALKDKFILPARKWMDCLRQNDYLDRRQLRQQLGVAENDFLVTLVGTYLPEKGHDLLAATINQMIKETPEMTLKLLLVGFWSHDSRERFLGIFGSSAISRKRTFFGVEELHGFYRASDCFVMNSQNRGECFGRVTVEAMAHKLPVLGTDAGGTRDIIESGVTGLLHPLGKEGQEALKENIATLYEDRTLAKEMGKAGLARVNRLFREERLLAEFNDAIQ